MLESKIHRATVADCDPDELESYEPRVVQVDAHNQIINVDREVATLLG
jgi:aspartate 1-decarboxylase